MSKMIRIQKCYDCPHKRFRQEKTYDWWCIDRRRPINFIHGPIPYWCRLEDAPEINKEKP